jgi:hypothetical protein
MNTKNDKLMNTKNDKLMNIKNERNNFIIFIKLYTNIQKEPIIFKFKNIVNTKYPNISDEQNFAAFSTYTYELPFRIKEFLENIFSNNQFNYYYYKRLLPYNEIVNKEENKKQNTIKFYIDDEKLKLKDEVENDKTFKNKSKENEFLKDKYKAYKIKINNINDFLYEKDDKDNYISKNEVREKMKQEKKLLDKFYIKKKDIYNIKQYSWDNKIYTSNLLIDGYIDKNKPEELFIFNRNYTKDKYDKYDNIKDKIRSSIIITYKNRLRNIDNFEFIELIEDDDFSSYKNDEDQIIFYISKDNSNNNKKYISLLNSYYPNYKIIRLTKDKEENKKDNKTLIDIDNNKFYINTYKNLVVRNKTFTNKYIVDLVKSQFNVDDTDRLSTIDIDDSYYLLHIFDNNDYTLIYHLHRSYIDNKGKLKDDELDKVFIIFNKEQFIDHIKDLDINKTRKQIENNLDNYIKEELDIIKEYIYYDYEDNIFNTIVINYNKNNIDIVKEKNPENDKKLIKKDNNNNKYYKKFEINVNLYLEQNEYLAEDRIYDNSNNKINTKKSANCKYHKYELLRLIDNMKENFKKNKKNQDLLENKKMNGGYNILLKQNNINSIYKMKKNMRTMKKIHKSRRVKHNRITKKHLKKTHRKPVKKVHNKKTRKVNTKHVRKIKHKHRRTMKKGGFSFGALTNKIKEQGQKAVELAKEQGQKALQIAQEQGQKAVEVAQVQANKMKEQGQKAVDVAKVQGQKAVELAKVQGQKAVDVAKVQGQKAQELVRQNTMM